MIKIVNLDILGVSGVIRVHNVNAIQMLVPRGDEVGAAIEEEHPRVHVFPFLRNVQIRDILQKRVVHRRLEILAILGMVLENVVRHLLLDVMQVHRTFGLRQFDLDRIIRNAFQCELPARVCHHVFEPADCGRGHRNDAFHGEFIGDTRTCKAAHAVPKEDDIVAINVGIILE